MTLLKTFIEPHIAGSPTNPEIRWVSLKPARLAELFFDEYKINVSNGFVKRALEDLNLRYRKRTKQLATGVYQQRDEQFKIIFALIVVMMNLGMPVISIDCKKKEVIGNLFREGKCYCNKAPDVFDHDYNHLAEGKVVPHGIYDLKLNRGYVTIGNSSETAAFVKDNLLWWWYTYGKNEYPNARCILILCDAGGANSYRHHIFKKEMLEFARETGLTIKVCHFPPYHSKWNPIEHRLFCHIHRAMSGNVFTSYETVEMLIKQTSTKQGLSVIVRLNINEYKTGIKIDKNEIDYTRISFHEKIPELNYEIAA